MLYISITFFIAILFSVWFCIFLFIKKNQIKEEKKRLFEKNFLQGIISIYSNVEIEQTNKKLKKLKKYLEEEPEYLWESASVFVKFNRVVKFAKEEKFKDVFEFLEISEILKEKMQSKNNYIKGKAIWLSYEFQLEKNIQVINFYKDDKNTLVRREAQIALVSFLGWRSLAFFPYITRYISLWQQIRIIEKLEESVKSVNEFDMIYLEKALLSQNKTIKQLLIRIIKKFKLQQYKHYVIEQLFTEDDKLEDIAILALKYLDISLEETKIVELTKTKFKQQQYLAICNNLEVAIY